MASKSKNIQIIVTSKGLKEVKRDLVSIRKLTGPGKNNNIKINLSVNQKFFQTSLQKAFKNIATKKLNLSINQAFFNKSLANAIAQAERRGIRLTANVIGTGRARPEQKRAERISGGAATSNIVGGVAYQRSSMIATQAATKAQIAGNQLVAKNVHSNKIVAKQAEQGRQATLKQASHSKFANKQLQNLNRAISLLNKTMERVIRSMLQIELVIKSNSGVKTGNTERQINRIKSQAKVTRRNLASATALEPYDPSSTNRRYAGGAPKHPSVYRQDQEAYRIRKQLDAGQASGQRFTTLTGGRQVDTREAIRATHEARRLKFDTGQLDKKGQKIYRNADTSEVNAEQVRVVKKLVASQRTLQHHVDKQSKEYIASKPPIYTSEVMGGRTSGARGSRPGGSGGSGGSGGGGGGRGRSITGADPYKRNRGIIGTKGGGGDFSHMASGMGGFVGMYAEVAAKTFALGAAFRALKEAADFGVLIDGMKAYEAASGASLLSVAKRVQEITQHTIGLKQASQGVTMSIAAGFDSTQIEAMATAAKNAGLALGRDLGDAFDRITKGVTKAEPELLDELGIILRLETASKKYAKTIRNLDGSIGKNVKELTTYEKQQAVLNEVITQAENKFGLLGKQMEGKANSLSAISAALTDTALKAGNFALDFDIIFGIASIKDVVKFFSENATAVIAAFSGLAIFLLKNMIPQVGKFTNKYSDAASRFAADSHAMAVSAKNSGTTFQSFAKQMNTMGTGAAFYSTIEDMGVNVTNAEGLIVNKFDNITNAYRNLLSEGGVNNAQAMRHLTDVAGGDVANMLVDSADKVNMSKLDLANDPFAGTRDVQKAMSSSLMSNVDGLIGDMETTGRRVGTLIDEGMGIEMDVTRRGLKDLRMQMLRTVDPKAYAKQLAEMESAVTGSSSSWARNMEGKVRSRMAFNAKKAGLRAAGKFEVQQAFQHEGTSAGWQEASYQAKRYGKEMDKLYKAEGKKMNLYHKALKSMGKANIRFGSQIASLGRGIMSGGMKAMQAVAIYTMLEAAVKGISKAFGFTTDVISKAISGANAFGEELDAQQEKWIGYSNQLNLFTNSLEGIGKAAGQEASSLESFSNSLTTMSVKWGQAIDKMTAGDKVGEVFSEMVFWSDSMSESMDEQTKKFIDTVKTSGHLKAIASALSIDIDSITLFDSKGRLTKDLARFQEETKKVSASSRNLESNIKDLALAFQGLGDAQSEFAKGLLTSTKFDTLVDQSKGLKKTFEDTFYNEQSIMAFEGTLDRAVEAVKEFKDTLGNLSFEIDLVKVSPSTGKDIIGLLGKDLERVTELQKQLPSFSEGIFAPNESFVKTKAINQEIHEVLSKANVQRQQEGVASQLKDSLLPQLKRTAFKHIPEEEWNKVSKAILASIHTKIADAAAAQRAEQFANMQSGNTMSGIASLESLSSDALELLVKDAVGKQITPDMIKQGMWKSAIASQIEGLSIELQSALETLLLESGRFLKDEKEGFLSRIHETVDSKLSFTEAKDTIREAIVLYDDFVKNAQRQFRYLQGEIDLMASAMTRLKGTGTSTDLIKSLNIESKILDSKQAQFRLTIKTLRLSKRTKENQEAIAQEQKKIADLELNRLSEAQIIHQGITTEIKYQYSIYEKNLGLITDMVTALESIGSINKSQVAHLNFVSTKQTSINSAIKDWLDIHTKYQKDLKSPEADKVKLLEAYTSANKIVGERLTNIVKIAKIERDSSYLDHKLDLYNKMVDRASALLDIQKELSGVHDANASTTESLAIISARESDLAKERLDSMRATTELTERHTLALQNAVGSTTDLTKWYKLEKAHMAFMLTTREELISLQALAALNTLKESSSLESINRHLVAQEELNNAKLTSSLHVNNIKARENRLSNIKKKFDIKALQHEHNVLKIRDKLENLELTSWERQNLIRDIDSEILEMEKEKVEVLEEYVEGLKAAHEAKKRIGEASLDDELYYRIKEMQEAMPSAIDSAANVMIGSINTAVDMMAENIKEGEGAFGAGGFENFAAKQWRAAGDTLIDSAAEKMKVASAKLMLGSTYITPEEKAVQALKKQDIGNNYLLDISATLKAIRDRRVDISNQTGTTINGVEDFYAKNKNKKVFDQFVPTTKSEFLTNAILAAETTGDRIADTLEKLVDIMDTMRLNKSLDNTPSWLGVADNLMSNEDRALAVALDVQAESIFKAQDNFNAQWDAMEHRLNTTPSWLGEPTNNLMSNEARAAAVAADKAAKVSAARAAEEEYLDLAMFQAEFDQEQMEAQANIERFIESLGYSMDRVISLGNKGKTATEVITNYTDKL